MDIGIYKETIPDNLVKQGLDEMTEMIEETLDIANKTSNPKKALTVFLEKLDIGGVVKKLPFNFSKKEGEMVKVQMDFTFVKASKTNPTNLMETVKNLLSKKGEVDNYCDECDEELKRIAASVEKMVIFSHRAELPSSVLLSFNEHLRDINMILPLALDRLGILK